MELSRPRRWMSITTLIVLVASLAFAVSSPTSTVVHADHTTDPTSVTLVGNLQDNLVPVSGCSEWNQACAATHLDQIGNGVWRKEFTVQAGSYEYKMALNDEWDESYAGNHQANGNTTLTVPAQQAVRFYYDHKTHAVLDSYTDKIAVAAGSFQSEIGCAGDWQPECVRSLLTDAEDDGIYTFQANNIPAGSYEFKVALDEKWDVAYPGENVPFTVGQAGSNVRITWSSTTNAVNVSVEAGEPAHDNNVEWDGLRHDSRDTLYRTPGGAVPAGTPVTIRFRTFHNDVTAVKIRLYDINAAGQRILPMSLAATDIACYQGGLENDQCDYWAISLPNVTANNLWYRFVVTDGTDTDYYADNTAALDGGLGSATDDPIDTSFALTVYTPDFSAPSWARKAVIYQIFPDRFRNGRSGNDADTGDVRYLDPVQELAWGVKPEGYCRNYSDGATNCPWRFGNPPPGESPTKEQPRGRDYYGGDLKGVDQSLDYLQALGITTLYFNPIFDAGSNHSYDTQDYLKIDPYFGTQKDWEDLEKHTAQRGMRIIVDGVFNHMSSDSPFFDRYQHYASVGACESASSPYRSWFHFRPPAGNEPSVCAPSVAGGDDTYYDGWFGFDSIPVLQKSNPAVQSYFLTAPNSVSRYWLNKGADGWRMDVMGDASFPDGYWESFRQTVRQTNPQALIIGELWQKDSTLLRYLRGDRADTTMNYRLRDAVIGLLAPGGFDSKGFGDSGHPLEPSEFASRLLSIREDYADPAYYSLMNLLDSHDTERLLWTLTPGDETTAAKEANAANIAAGKQRMRLASLIQFSTPGAPTVYYGDEVGVTGDDDPDDRRTYPWADRGGNPDTAMLAHYQKLAELRRLNGALVDGDLRVLLADDSADTVAFGRRTGSQAAIVAINRGDQVQTLSIPVGGYLPDGTSLARNYGVGNDAGGSVTVSGGSLQVALNPLSGLLLTTGTVDLTPPAAPAGLTVAREGDGAIDMTWNSVPGASAYNIYRSQLSGGGWTRINTTPLVGTSFTDSGLRNASAYYYVARALDSAGNESTPSNEVSGLPHYTIGWANLQWPPTLNHIISTVNRTDNIYGQVWIDSVTNHAGQTPSLRAQLGYGPDGSDPATDTQWNWVDAVFNTDQGNNDEFVASLLPEAIGDYDYAYRYTTTNGRDWTYADLDGIGNGYSPAQAGSLTVLSSGDTTAPAAPANLRVVAASPAGIAVAWDAVTGDPSLDGYEIRRADTPGGPYTTIALVTGDTDYNDTSVAEGATYYYVIRSRDTSFNRSPASPEVSATAALRTVHLMFNVTVPATTDATGRSVYIAGFLDRLDGGLPQWNPGGVVLTRLDTTHWTIELTGKEGTQIEYKYALGSWDYVEKDGSCGEIANRQLTLSYGINGTQLVNDAVPNWRNVPPCGN